jgi:hypothetical protein
MLAALAALATTHLTPEEVSIVVDRRMSFVEYKAEYAKAYADAGTEARARRCYDRTMEAIERERSSSRGRRLQLPRWERVPSAISARKIWRSATA